MELQPPKRTTTTASGVMVDLLIVAGLGLVTYGSWLVFAPAGFLVPGAVLLIIGLAAAVVRR